MNVKNLKKWIVSSIFMGIIAGCTSSEDKPVLHIYTAFDAKEASFYVDKFEKDTNIEVKWVRLSAGEVLARLEAEKNNPQVGLWFGGPAPEFMVAKSRGLITPYDIKADFEFDSKNKDSDSTWTGFYFGAIGFASNEEYFKKKNLKVPDSWEDLLSMALKGQVSMAYPYTSGTAYTIVSTILQVFGEEKGWEYIKKLDKQIHHYNKSGSAAVTQAGLGEIAVGISFSHDILKKGKATGYPVALSFPSEGTGYEIGAMALVKNGPQQELAKKFMEYFISLKGQNLLKNFFRVPLHPKAEVAEGSVTADKVKLISFNFEKAAKEQKGVLSKWRSTVSR